MKKKIAITSILIFVVLFMATTQAIATASFDDDKPRNRTPGAELTESVREKTKEVMEKTKEAIERATERAAEKTEKPIEKTKEALEKTKEGIEKATEMAREKTKHVLEKTKEALEKTNDSHGEGHETENGKKYHFRGVISAVDSQTLTLKLENGSPQVFKLSSTVKIKIPTLGRDATVADLKPNMQVSVQAVKIDVGYEARMVLVIPAKPTKVHHVGVVTAYTAGASLTVKDKNGVEMTFVLNADTKIIREEHSPELIVGVKVTVIFSQDVSGSVLTAKGVVVHCVDDDLKTPEPTKSK